MSFSIVVPLYNKARSIQRTLDSLLSQTYSDYEIIVIDDGSTDGSREVVENDYSTKVRLVSKKNEGVSVARNTGASMALNPYLIFIDADDFVAPFYLENINELINRYPHAGAFGTRYSFSDSGRIKPCKIYGMKNELTLIEDYFYTASRGDLPVIASGICIPREVFNRAGGFPVNQVQGEDQDLWSRIGLEYSMAVHPAYAITYVQDADNRVSINLIPDHELDYSKNLQKKMDQKQLPDAKVRSVKHYIAGHLIQVASLNICSGNYLTAQKLLSDFRCKSQFIRWGKWQLILVLTLIKSLFKNVHFQNRKRKVASASKPVVENLLNDKNMGGILTIVKSLSSASLLNSFQFKFSVVNPSGWNKRNYAADVIVVHYASSWKTIIPNLLIKLLNFRSKLIIQEHHYTKSFERKVPNINRFRLMLKINYAIADKVVSVSHGQAGWLNDSQLLDQSRLAVISQCCRLDDFLEVKRKAVVKEVVIGAYGRFCAEKGFDNLISAFNQVNSTDLRLMLAGDGPLDSALKRKARKNKNIQFVGRVSDIPGFLSQCDVIIIPSTTEAFGLVCLESKAAGKPVIVSDIDGLSEQVEMGSHKESRQCGITIPESNIASIASVLNQVPQMPLLLWGENGRKAVRNSWREYQLRWGRLLVSMCLR